jgi:hypothetical protein
MTIKYVRNEEGHFVCQICNDVKKHQNSMHYHMKKHMEDLDYVCKVCKKGFLQKQTLEAHVKSKHPEMDNNNFRYKCSFDNCKSTAQTKGNCMIHMVRIHFQVEVNEILGNNENVGTICCNKCMKTFNSGCSFYYHAKDCLDNTTEKFNKLNRMDVIRL